MMWLAGVWVLEGEGILLVWGQPVSVECHLPSSGWQLDPVHHLAHLLQYSAGSHPMTVEFRALALLSPWAVHPDQFSSQEVPPPGSHIIVPLVSCPPFPAGLVQSCGLTPAGLEVSSRTHTQKEQRGCQGAFQMPPQLASGAPAPTSAGLVCRRWGPARQICRPGEQEEGVCPSHACALQ